MVCFVPSVQALETDFWLDKTLPSAHEKIVLDGCKSCGNKTNLTTRKGKKTMPVNCAFLGFHFVWGRKWVWKMSREINVGLHPALPCASCIQMSIRPIDYTNRLLSNCLWPQCCSASICFAYISTKISTFGLSFFQLYICFPELFGLKPTSAICRKAKKRWEAHVHWWKELLFSSFLSLAGEPVGRLKIPAIFSEKFWGF